MLSFHFFVISFLLCLDYGESQDITCKNEKGKPVEWFVAYKLPTFKPMHDGLEYFYMDSHSPWTKSPWKIDSVMSSPAKTLAPLYNKNQSESLFYALYNDEWPNGHKSFTRGHTKGVFIADSKSGIWLVHSVPKYPPFVNSTYGYPHSGQMFGQSFLCLSVLPEQFDKIGIQWLHNYPYIYDKNVPSDFKDKFPNLYAATISHHITSPPWFSTQNILTSNGSKFISFAKAKNFDQDLYDSLVAPTFSTSLWTETWQNGIDYLGPYCKSEYTVKNIKKIAFPNGIISFNSSHDHSKWALSSNLSFPVICIGDINRMSSQFKRGGGTVCMVNSAVWKTYKNLVRATDSCNEIPSLF